MLKKKVFLSPENKSELICSACNRHFQIDMSQYLQIPGEVKIRVKCKCGHAWSIVLEKRRFYRKKTQLKGKYKYQISGKNVLEGALTVLDISRTGLRLKIDGKHNLKDGDWIEIEFRLDNQVKTLINRIVNIKNVNGEYIGASFRDKKSFDPVIGFYMLQHTRNQEEKN